MGSGQFPALLQKLLAIVMWPFWDYGETEHHVLGRAIHLMAIKKEGEKQGQRSQHLPQGYVSIDLISQ